MTETPFLDRLKAAAIEGIVVGVKIGCALVAILVIAGWFLGDYAVTKANASKGAAVWQEMQRQQAERQKALPKS